MTQIITFTPLVAPELDDRSEVDLVNYALDVVFAKSGGRLNDFSTTSPARALIESQAFAGAELLYRANKFADRVAIQFLTIAGIQQRLGVAAQVTLTFTLTSLLGNPFAIPQGYQVKDSTGTLTFETDVLLTIPSGSLSGIVSATCTTTGSTGNVGSYTINQLTQPLAFLNTVTNTAPATGGLDAETDDAVKARGFASIRRRGLISADDYEQEAISVLGLGSVAYAIGNLAADGITRERGAVHIFCLNADGTLLSQAQLNSLQADMQSKTNISVFVYASNIDIVPVDVTVIASLIPGTNPTTIADNIYTALNAYLTPGSLGLGEAVLIKELEYLARGAGIQYLQSVTIGDHLATQSSTNYALPYSYSAANLSGLAVELVDTTTGTVYTTAYGAGDPD